MRLLTDIKPTINQGNIGWNAPQKKKCELKMFVFNFFFFLVKGLWIKKHQTFFLAKLGVAGFPITINYISH